MLVNTIVQPDYFKSTFQKCQCCWELHKRAARCLKAISLLLCPVIPQGFHVPEIKAMLIGFSHIASGNGPALMDWFNQICQTTWEIDLTGRTWQPGARAPPVLLLNGINGSGGYVPSTRLHCFSCFSPSSPGNAFNLLLPPIVHHDDADLTLADATGPNTTC